MSKPTTYHRSLDQERVWVCYRDKPCRGNSASLPTAVIDPREGSDDMVRLLGLLDGDYAVSLVLREALTMALTRYAAGESATPPPLAEPIGDTHVFDANGSEWAKVEGYWVGLERGAGRNWAELTTTFGPLTLKGGE